VSNIDDRPTLAVVGAGPKALALVAKAAALEKTGWSVPRLVVLDKRGLAASWSGAHGYTDGSPLLGTPPEKDVGYPYEGGWGKSSAAVIDEMRRLSWQSYIIQSDLYSDWIGQGRLSPNHRRWDAYLRWLGEGVELEPVIVEVTSIDLLDGRWRLTAARIGGGSVTVNCDGLVLTGPGDPITVPGQEEGDVRITNGRTFWLEKEAFAASGPIEVCVIGSGETAGSIVVALLDVLAEGSFIELVSAHGVIYSRGESFLENHLYSNPFPDWPRLAERHRREFLKRTDRGVFSVQAESVLDSAENVRPVAGRVTRLERSGEKVVADIE
jgi:mycobactin lysine-N-oxygenase